MCPVSTPPFVRNGQGLLPNGSAAIPSLSFINSNGLGFYRHGDDQLGLSFNGVFGHYFSASVYWISSITAQIILNDTYLVRDGAANILALKNGVAPQTFRKYRTYTDASNYERLALQSVAGIIKIDAETLGSGVDDLDLQLTPSGIGKVRFGTYAADALGLVTGYITIKDEAGNIRKLMIQA